MKSLMPKRLSSHLLTCTRGPCAVPASMCCGVRGFSLAQKNTPPTPSPSRLTAKYSAHSSQSYTVIYRLPQITLLRAVSRLKLLQTGLTVVILPPVYYLYLQGDLSLFLVGYSTGIAGFAGVMLYAASYFFRRVVGMMYLDASQTTLKVSHLTFWGKRSDLFLPVSDIMTIADTGDSTSETILKLKTYSSPETFYFSTYYGRIVDPDGFEKVFGSLK
ncbi:transmembrane protein 186 [Eucyclogobius newberryi]|uniref:transmembrane protein 186 n=1 Tax=Eucyclogobius newberryi TaxID=166745 RepID=UPI003B5CE40D